MALGLLALGLALGMYISYFLCRFHLRLVVNAKPVSSGIWALRIDSSKCGPVSFFSDYFHDIFLQYSYQCIGFLIECSNIYHVC